MAENSSIEWTDATWNPVTGCTKISAGCDHCYAARFSERFRGVPGHPFETGFDLTLRPARLAQPLAWKRPRMIFVNSMSDLFHKDIPKAHIAAVFDTMEKADWHIYQVLTKRSSLLQKFINERYESRKAPAHMWFGVFGRKSPGQLAGDASAQGERKYSFPVGRAADWVGRKARSSRHRLGNRRRGKRSSCPPDGPGMGD
jgi:protein gp37